MVLSSPNAMATEVICSSATDSALQVCFCLACQLFQLIGRMGEARCANSLWHLGIRNQGGHTNVQLQQFHGSRWG